MLALLEAIAQESQNASAGGVFTVVSTGAAAIAAIGACWAAKATKDATRAQLLSDLSEEFWSTEYHDACRELAEFFEVEAGTWMDDWKHQVRRFKWFLERETSSERMEAVDRARRRVKGYYHRIWQLTQASLLDEEQVREELSPERNLPILFRTIEPLECAVTEGYDPNERGELYRFYSEEVCPDEEFYRPVLEEGCPSFSEEGDESSSA